MKKGINNPMKLCLLLIIMALLTNPVLADLSPNIIVAGYAVPEGSIAPGKDFVLELTLENIEAATCALATTVTAQTSAPFILQGPATFSAGRLCVDDKAVVRVPMRVDPAATGGSYQLNLALSYESTTLIQFSSSTAVTLLVEGSPHLVANIVNAVPVNVYPGDSATISVSIANDGSFEARTVTGELTSTGALEISSSGSFTSFGTIPPKDVRTGEFSIDVPKDAASGDYQLSFSIEYQDENLARQVIDAPLTFHVKEKAKFDVMDAGTGSLYANQNNRLVKLSVTNTGTDVAKKLRIKVLPQYPFSTDGSVRYVENLAPGESAPVEFSADVDKDGTSGTYGLDLLVQYEDSQGKEFQDTATFSLMLAKTSFLRGVFLNYWYLWTVAIIIGFFVVRNRMKK